MTDKKYELIYCDPPWQFSNKKTGGSMVSGAANQYTVTCTDDLKRLDIESLCADNCVLVMWWVGAMPQDAIDLVNAWGFTLKNMNGFVWDKLTVKLLKFFGMGFGLGRVASRQLLPPEENLSQHRALFVRCILVLSVSIARSLINLEG